jgi:hypothetical protein
VNARAHSCAAILQVQGAAARECKIIVSPAYAHKLGRK